MGEVSSGGAAQRAHGEVVVEYSAWLGLSTSALSLAGDSKPAYTLRSLPVGDGMLVPNGARCGEALVLWEQSAVSLRGVWSAFGAAEKPRSLGIHGLLADGGTYLCIQHSERAGDVAGRPATLCAALVDKLRDATDGRAVLTACREARGHSWSRASRSRTIEKRAMAPRRERDAAPPDVRTYNMFRKKLSHHLRHPPEQQLSHFWLGIMVAFMVAFACQGVARRSRE